MNRPRQRAFTLIETIAVISAIAFVAAALFLPLIRRLDEAARQKEVTALANLAAAYKERVMTTRTIPDHTGWAAAVAAANGWQLNVINNTDRGLQRVFLIDPTLKIGTNAPGTFTLPYSQSIVGHTYNAGLSRPEFPRLMIISSVGAALPSTLVSGVGNAVGVNAFATLWTTTNGTIPGSWSSWTGRAEDLKIQRIDLSDLFVRVALNNRDAQTNLPKYSVSMGIDSFVTNTVTSGCRFPMYFLKGSEIRLYNVAGTNEHAEFLSQSQSFTFEKGTWEPEAYTAASVGQPSAIDLQKAFDKFMAAPTNSSADASMNTVSNAMMNFLSNYVTWRSNSYVLGNGNRPPDYVANAQDDLAAALDDIINITPN